MFGGYTVGVLVQTNFGGILTMNGAPAAEGGTILSTADEWAYQLSAFDRSARMWRSRMQRNSAYVIHPNELLADNFALLMEWWRTGLRPSTTPSGFRVNDVDLLVAIEEALSVGCSSAVEIGRRET